MKFCHIAPVAHLDLIQQRSAHLTLAHLIDEGHEDYIDFYKAERKRSDGSFINIIETSLQNIIEQRLWITVHLNYTKHNFQCLIQKS